MYRVQRIHCTLTLYGCTQCSLFTHDWYEIWKSERICLCVRWIFYCLSFGLFNSIVWIQWRIVLISSRNIFNFNFFFLLPLRMQQFVSVLELLGIWSMRYEVKINNNHLIMWTKPIFHSILFNFFFFWKKNDKIIRFENEFDSFSGMTDRHRIIISEFDWSVLHLSH